MSSLALMVLRSIDTQKKFTKRRIFAQLHIITGDKNKKKVAESLKKDMGLLREHLLSLSS